jgi:hypothetical protein
MMESETACGSGVSVGLPREFLANDGFVINHERPKAKPV